MPLPKRAAAALTFCLRYKVPLHAVETAYSGLAADAGAPPVPTVHATAFADAGLKMDVIATVGDVGDATNAVTVMAGLFTNSTTYEFFDAMVEEIERTVLKAAPTSERGQIVAYVASMLENRGRMGLLQRVIDEGRGFLSHEFVLDLQGIVLATGVVQKEDGTSIGTAFLVGPDLVLTSHHVACLGDDRLKEGLQVCFHSTEKPREAPSVKSFARKLVSSSPHFGPLGKTPWELTAAADGKLDYALIRLDRHLSDRKPIVVTEEGPPARGEHGFIFGFPGGTALKVDTAVGLDPKDPGSRFLHRLNTAPGMSGGPLVNGAAVAVGLHEAGFDPSATNAQGLDDKGWKDTFNRAIDLAKVVAHIKATTGSKTPFAAGTLRNDLAIYSADLRKSWARQGQNLAASLAPDEASRIALVEEWNALVAQLGDPSPSAAQMPKDILHPVFRRDGMTAWLMEAIQPGAFEQVLVVKSSEEGRSRGHSFLAEICATRLADPERTLLRLNWKSTAMGSWRSPTAETSNAASRPEAGVVLLDDASALVAAHLASLDAAADGESGVAIVDLGGLSDIHGRLCDEWEALTIRLATSGYRVILIDPPESRWAGMASALSKAEIEENSGYQVITDMSHLAWQNIYDWMRRFDGKEKWPPAARDKLKAVWDDPARLHNRYPDFTTLEAVWFGLAREQLRGPA